ncbi:kynurenine formamidase-like [Orbicella faveolata]|uniref:kynurenine formamidase-like n=1 Tax=Orbicella faveolata TaxID=48498 RepID=UPI0009E2495D|nr:kynurenine formamidase-like [Orbicella faveolata]
MDGKEGFDGKSKEWLEKFYSPSRWSKRLTADKVVEYHFKVCTEYSETTRQSLNGELSIAYGEKKAKMDIFYPTAMIDDARYANSAMPVLLFVHGGYWKLGSRKTYAFVSNAWIKAGCIAAIVGYNLAPEASLEQMVTEIQAAVKFVVNRFPKSNLFLCGHSAGAHLCAMMMVSDWSKDPCVPQAVRGMFLISGVFDVLPILGTYANDVLKLDEESAARLSPQRILMKMSPTICCPVRVVVEEHGSPEFIRQSKEFADILKSYDVQASFLELPGVDHFDIIENMMNPEDYLCKEILKIVQE